MSEKKKEGKGKRGKGKQKKGDGKQPAAEGATENVPAVPPKLKEIKDQEVFVGKKLVLKCEASTEQPSLKFKWFKDEKEINGKNKPENIKIRKKSKKLSELHINKALWMDGGEYKCMVFNKLGNDSIRFNVTIKPTVSPPPLGTGHLIRCMESERNYCVNGGECYILNGITSSSKYLCKCQPGFTGARCTDTVPLRFVSTGSAQMSLLVIAAKTT